MSKKQEEEMKAKEILDQLIADGRIKVSYTVHNVYSCILKDGKLEIEDNREEIKKLMHPNKSVLGSDSM
jgi:hypothetical protein